MLGVSLVLTGRLLYMTFFSPIEKIILIDHFPLWHFNVSYEASASVSGDGSIMLTERCRIKAASPLFTNPAIAGIDNGSIAAQEVTSYTSFTEPCDKNSQKTCAGVEATLSREITLPEKDQGVFLSRAEIALTPLTVTYTQPGFDRWKNGKPFTWDFTRRTNESLRLEGIKLKRVYIEIRLPKHSLVSADLPLHDTTDLQQDGVFTWDSYKPTGGITAYYLSRFRYRPVQIAAQAAAALADIEWSRYFIIWWGGLSILCVLLYAYLDKK
jgi:hypothetical protein